CSVRTGGLILETTTNSLPSIAASTRDSKPVPPRAAPVTSFDKEAHGRPPRARRRFRAQPPLSIQPQSLDSAKISFGEFSTSCVRPPFTSRQPCCCSGSDGGAVGLGKVCVAEWSKAKRSTKV